MHASTHKSLFGPQKGMILCREASDIAERIARMTMPTFVSNIHSHHVAALGVALEGLEDVGIFVNAIRVPFTGRCGLRIGLSEITRRGMSESEMDVIADLVARCIAEKSSPASLRAAVEELSRRFDELSFAFSS